MNVLDVGGTLVNVNDHDVDRTPVNVYGPGVDRDQTGWIRYYSDSSHPQIPLLGYLGPFSGAYPLPLTPNLLPVYATVQAPRLSRPIACAPKHLILSSLFGMTPLQGQTILLHVHAFYLHAFFAFALAT